MLLFIASTAGISVDDPQANNSKMRITSSLPCLLTLACLCLIFGGRSTNARLSTTSQTSELLEGNHDKYNVATGTASTASSVKFALAISSDPQYVSYDNVNPPGLTTDDEKKGNSARQIRQQYASMNQLMEERQNAPTNARRNHQAEFPIVGAIINGDLTASGDPSQLAFMKKAFQSLDMKVYPGLGDRDYADDTNNTTGASDTNSDRDTNIANNRGANQIQMVKFMYQWLQKNSNHDKNDTTTTTLTSYDMFHRSYYQFPDFRVDYYGSMSYSFTLGGTGRQGVHFVQLQNYPTYARNWNAWDGSSFNPKHAHRDFVFIQSSLSWLEHDLALARNRGESIIVNLHDNVDHFSNGTKARTVFDSMLVRYNVSAIFGGHIHPQCGFHSYQTSAQIPFFVSGSATYQQYLVVDFDLDQGQLQVRNRRDTTLTGAYEYVAGAAWNVTLVRPLPNPPLPVPPARGHITFYCDGGFVALGEMTYTRGDTGETVTHQTHNLALGNMAVYEIPGDATDLHIQGYYVLAGRHTIFQERFDAPPNTCFRMFGTLFKPHWDNSCGSGFQIPTTMSEGEDRLGYVDSANIADH